MPDTEDTIGEGVFAVSPDLTGFRQKLEAGIAKATAKISVKVRVEPDVSGFKNELTAKLKALDVRFKVKLGADSRGFAGSTQVALKKVPQQTYKVKLVADEAGFQRSVRKALKNSDTPTASVGGRDSGSSTAGRSTVRPRFAEVGGVQSALHVNNRITQNLSEHLKLRRSLQEAFEADHARALVMDAQRAEAAERAHTRVVELQEKERERLRKVADAQRRKTFAGPTPIDFGGEGIRPMNLLKSAAVALTPVLFSVGASALQASTSIAALGSASIGAALGVTGLVIGFSRLTEAFSLREQVRKEELQASAKAASAQVGDIDSVRAAMESAQEARHDLVRAQRAEADAEREIHNARREAIRDLEDLREAISDLKREESSDRVSLTEAKERRDAVYRDYFSSMTERRRADADVADAADKLSDTQRERKRSTSDLRTANRVGIDGSDKVQAAIKARDSAAEATRNARNRVAQASRSLTKATSPGGGSGPSAAAAQLEELRKKLSPAANAILDFADKNDALFARLRKNIEGQTLPGFLTFLEAITATSKKGAKDSILEMFANQAGELGGKIGTLVGKFGLLTREPWFRSDMAEIHKNNGEALDIFGGALLKLVKPITTIIKASSPLLTRFAKGFGGFADWLDRVIASAEKSGSLKKWFDDAGTAMGKWVDIAKNVVTFLGDLFRASLPSGTSLVDRFKTFTDQMVKWSGSAKGQKSIKDFFATFEKIDYAATGKFLLQLGAFMAAYQLMKFTAKSPMALLFSAFAVWAASHPEKAAAAMNGVFDAISGVIKFVTDHPTGVATTLALLAAAKAGKSAVDIGIKLPGVDNLKGFLTGKFKWLDTIVGGQKAAVMNVQAGVVNVYGAVGGGLPGKGGKPGVPPVKPGRKPRLAPVKPRLAPVKPGLGGGGKLAAAAAVAAALYGGEMPTDLGELAKLLLGGLPLPLGDNPQVKGAVARWEKERKATPSGQMLPSELEEKAKKHEARTAGDLEQFVRHRGGNLTKLDAKEQTELNRLMKEYVYSRKLAVQYGGEVKKIHEGELAAQKYITEENKRTSGAVAAVYQGYGISKARAQEFAGVVTGIPDETTVKLGADTATGKARIAAIQEDLDHVTKVKPVTFGFPGYQKVLDKVNALSDIIDSIPGPKWVDVKLRIDATAEEKLNWLVVSQRALASGIDIEAASKKAAEQWKAAGFAAGGKVGGFSPHPRADNIPAMLTANEYVQPVAAVKKYGLGMMEDIRTGRYPTYAAGGPVKWPFNVNLKKIKTDYDRQPSGDIGFFPDAGEGFPAWPRSPGAQRGNTGVWKKVVNLIKSSGIRQGSFGNGYRPGDPKWHGSGRAVDWMGYNMDELATFLARQRPLELIHRTRKRDYAYTRGRNMGSFNSGLMNAHRNHIHIAMADGGLVPARMGKYDTGGDLHPGYTLAYNGTGRTETVRTSAQEKNLQDPRRIDKRDLMLLAQYITAASARPIHMDGRKVAEIVFGHGYLPGGV